MPGDEEGIAAWLRPPADTWVIHFCEYGSTPLLSEQRNH